ncbi:hypothetical protein ZIOFF_026472 [Zingiber officinale]|uniref:Photolyase/cryptochrome alpha/beta domain-containing protein n=1 Tax=Zingiber officinale TaxID=94328 RepID=A0A8J5GXH8_ZINOF|nr:hypothetical protein ZIOFF_026472 [Zingiber officinale]
MALVFSLRPNSCIAFFPSHPFATSRCLPAYAATIRATASAGVQADAARCGAALVWFKNDLRADDHPGLLAAAAKHKTVVPLYVFDCRTMSSLSDEMLELLFSSVKDLKEMLTNQGSDLLLGFGSTEDFILEVANKVKPTHIYAEEESEYDLRKLTTAVQSSLSAVPLSWGHPEFVFWRTPFYDLKNLKELPASYDDFTKLKLPVSRPLPAPAMPILRTELKLGTIPSFNDVKKYLYDSTARSDKIWISWKNVSAQSTFKKSKHQVVARTDPTKKHESHDRKSELTSTNLNNELGVKNSSSMFTTKGSHVKGGTSVALNALAAYLRYLEGTARDDWQQLHDKLRNTESRKGASFRALFGSALYLGIISRRRVYYEAIKYEKERNAGFLSPFGYSAPTVAAAIDAVCSMEYTAAGNEGPAVLLVHGFGAFLEHFRGNIDNIADGGFRVWAVTLLGFGKSEKPNIIYTELFWAELLRDFVVDVVREPVHLVGNSLGGYFAAIVAGLWPSLVKSVVLINTAGFIVPSYSSSPVVNEGRISALAWLQAQVLLLYLRSRAGQIIQKCYPTKVERADSWLIGEILRAVSFVLNLTDGLPEILKLEYYLILSYLHGVYGLNASGDLNSENNLFSGFEILNHAISLFLNQSQSFDPGVAFVLESVVNFNLSIPLNYLLNSFGGEVLVIQGMKDPLTKSEAFLSMIKSHCSNATVSELDAGHCPHDEVPEKVNPILREWIKRAEKCVRSFERT